MIIVSPSILSADFANLSSELQVMKNAGAPWAHVDVMDGHFVPNISIGVPVVASLRKATDLFLDVHLMIDTPIKYVDQFIASGADMVVIHLESDTPEMIHKTLARIHELGCKAGLTIKPGTPVEAMEPFLNEIDMALIMTVEPGFGGQKFMADMMPKMRKLRQMLDEVNPDCILEVDGGVDANTCAVCKENGAEVLVAGSAYFKADDKIAFVKEIQK
jgi:ribulose-phosphate 3-epimerase